MKITEAMDNVADWAVALRDWQFALLICAIVLVPAGIGAIVLALAA